MQTSHPLVEIKGITMAYDGFVVQRDLDFAIERGEIFVVMGTSGCGKTTLLRHLVGLKSPAKGESSTTERASGARIRNAANR